MAPILEVIWWWAVATGIWLLTLSSTPTPELAIAAASGLPCAVAATVGRRLAGERWRGRVQWAAWLAHLPSAVLIDAVRVIAVAARSIGRSGEQGQLHTVQLPDEPDTVAATRRALGGALLSATPATFLVESKPDEKQIIVHSLVESGPGWAQIDPSSH
jgi:multisubunit Na+/H+ antiporter MnhE subunit